MTPLRVMLVLGATHRLARLVTADKIAEPLRERMRRRGEWWEYLSTCDWCVSMYFAPVVAGAAVAFPRSRVLTGALLALSASAFAGNMALLEGFEESAIEELES